MFSLAYHISTVSLQERRRSWRGRGRGGGTSEVQKVGEDGEVKAK